MNNSLSNRTYQVKVGDALSFEYSNLYGTPQGSSYSPLLFLIMVNDFPKMSLHTSDGFFTDDCTIWRSGINIESVLQPHSIEASSSILLIIFIRKSYKHDRP